SRLRCGCFVFFFFQAEDGIRDFHVTGVQTCALPISEPKRGLVAAAGGVMRLPRRIPYHIAMEIALTGDFYPATRLHELGLVNRITPAGKALEEATELAKKIAANAPLALAATKKIMVESIDWSLDEMFAKQDEIT